MEITFTFLTIAHSLTQCYHGLLLVCLCIPLEIFFFLIKPYSMIIYTFCFTHPEM